MSDSPSHISPEIAAHFQREADALLEKHPDWRSDPQKAIAELNQLRKDLVEHYGYAEHEVAVIPNHRNIEVARDALAYRKQQAAAKKRSEAAAQQKAERDASQRKRSNSVAMKEKLAKARGNFGARAEIMAEHLDKEMQ